MIMDNKAELERITEKLQSMLDRNELPSKAALESFFRYAYQLGHFDGHIAGVKFATNS
jgi:hypothetical protein